jgi:two-component system nitrogen regulation response regulator GlnG
VDARRAALILVVEDDASSARALAKLLRADGYEVELARDGAAAIARLSRAPLPDILCTDLQLPYASGIAIARYCRSLAPGTPLVLTTAYPEQATELVHEMVPPPVVLTKPIDYDALGRALGDLTSSR